MYLRLLQKLIARDEREKHHVAALYRRDTRRTQWVGWLVGGTLALLLMQVISRPQELLIFLCFAAFLLAHPFRSVGRNQEEFAFTLPLPRRLYWQYDLATLVLPLAALSLFGTVVVSLDLAAKFWGLFLDGPWVQARELWGADKPNFYNKPEDDALPRLHLLPVIYIPILLGACLSLISWCCRSIFMRAGLWIVLIGLMVVGQIDQIHGINEWHSSLLEWDLAMYLVCFPASFWTLLITFPFLWWLADGFVDEREVAAAMGEESMSAPRIPLPQWSRLGLGSGRAFVGLMMIVVPLLLLIQFHKNTLDLWEQRFTARDKLDLGDTKLREPTAERVKNRPSEDSSIHQPVLMQIILRDEISGKIILAEEREWTAYPNNISGAQLYVYGAEKTFFGWKAMTINGANTGGVMPIDPHFAYNNSDFNVFIGEIGSMWDRIKIGSWTRLTDDLLDPRFCQTPLRVSQGQSLWVRSLIFDAESSFTQTSAKESLRKAEAEELKRFKGDWREDYPKLVYPGEIPNHQRRLLPMWDGGHYEGHHSHFRLCLGEVLLLSLLLGFGLLLGPRRLLLSLPLGGFLIVVGLALFEAKVGAQWKKEGIPVIDHFLASPAKDGGVR